MRAGVAEQARGRFHNSAHCVLRCRAVVAVLLVTVGGAAASAGAAPLADPWLSYVDAAVEARDADAPLAAEALLEAAYELAKESDPKGARPAITRLLLTATYAALDQMDKARSMAGTTGEGLRLDVNQLDESLLPLAGSLAKVSEKAFTRWKKFNQEKARDQAGTSRWETINTAKLEAAIRQHAAPGAIATARAVQFYARVLLFSGQTKDSLEKFAEGVKIYQGIEQSSQALVRGGELLALSPRKDVVVGDDDSGLMYDADWDRARAYLWNGEDLLEKKETAEEANNNFHSAEAIFKSLVSQIERYWPGDKTLGSLYEWLGTLYDSDHLNLLAEGEAAYRHSLSVFASNEGPEGERVRSSAKALAAILRQEAKTDEAAAIEARYGVTSTSAKK